MSTDEVTEGETLPAYMVRLTTRSRPKWQDVDIVDDALAQHRTEAREEAKLAAAVDRQGLLARIRARKQGQINHRLDELERQLTGGSDEQQ
jgi:hypothetical protein